MPVSECKHSQLVHMRLPELKPAHSGERLHSDQTLQQIPAARLTSDWLRRRALRLGGEGAGPLLDRKNCTRATLT